MPSPPPAGSAADIRCPQGRSGPDVFYSWSVSFLSPQLQAYSVAELPASFADGIVRSVFSAVGAVVPAGDRDVFLLVWLMQAKPAK